MRRYSVLLVFSLLLSVLVPARTAQAMSLVQVVFDGEMHVVYHRCASLIVTCDFVKNFPSPFVIYASEAKKPRKDGQPTRCFASKMPVFGKQYGPVGPFCDLNLAGVWSAVDPLESCGSMDAAFTGSLSFYESHDGGPKKISNIAGTFHADGPIGVFTMWEQKTTKPQEGVFTGLIILRSQDDGDALQDCISFPLEKDDPSQWRISGWLTEWQEDQWG